MMFIWSLVSFIVAITLLVAVHEWGHLAVARLCGVQVQRYSIGFGKALWSRTAKSGTVYQVGILPIGGYVKLLDEREGPVPPALADQALGAKPLWQRLSVVLAGPVLNFLFAILAYALMFWIGIQTIAPVIGEVVPGKIGDKAGLQVEDRIVAVDGHPVYAWRDVIQTLFAHPGDADPVQLTIKRAAETKTLALPTVKLPKVESLEDVLTLYGLVAYKPPLQPVVGDVQPTGAAAKAGVKANDRIVSVNGTAIETWRPFVDLVKGSPGQPLSLSIMRGEMPLTLTVTPEAKLEDGKEIGVIGIYSKPHDWPDELIQTRQYGFTNGLIEGVRQTGRTLSTSVGLLKQLVTGYLGIHNLSGPIGIAQGAGISASIGFAHFLSFLALVSISLGIINLLPIPLLDGGRAFFYLIEAIIRRRIPEKVEYYAVMAGLLMIASIMLIAILNDLKRLI